MGLAEEFAADMGFLPESKPANLTRVTPGTRVDGSLGSGTNPTETLHACRAFVGRFESDQIDGTLIKGEDRVISIYAATITPAAVPEPNDKIAIDGAVYRIMQGSFGVQRDPWGVMYSCHARQVFATTATATGAIAIGAASAIAEGASTAEAAGDAAGTSTAEAI